jgi:hypothetical protein
VNEQTRWTGRFRANGERGRRAGPVRRPHVFAVGATTRAHGRGRFPALSARIDVGALRATAALQHDGAIRELQNPRVKRRWTMNSATAVQISSFCGAVARQVVKWGGRCDRGPRQGFWGRTERERAKRSRMDSYRAHRGDRTMRSRKANVECMTDFAVMTPWQTCR